ncbi:efflux RND transporter periplasmic adaptor subunit [Shewanella algae]|uniref:efflux RND transporter periplasmic adaptor subunit n=1 Tax=Shewanella algae TaxID=38313 RepID=UPI000BDA3BB1|nr:efflux RND transporter periplasmic adaptor subunit [Shewanella algae]PBQ25719.1 efflux transporter periplasmic adaptor subunit [Shewanella algae]
MTRVKPTGLKVSLLCSSVVFMLWGCGNSEQPQAASAALPLVQVMELPAPVSDRVHLFSGILESDKTAELSFRVPGTLEQILADEGSEVKKGQVIARLDPHDFRVSVMELEARLSEAEAAHRLAAIELKRVRAAMNDKAIAGVKLDRAISAEARANAGVELLKQSLKKAQDSLAYTSLKAPYDGVIGKRFVDRYELVDVGTQIVTIHQPTTLNAVVDVSESQIWNLRQGASGEVSWFNAEGSVAAEITQIASVPDRLKRTYEVTFSLKQAPRQLVAGKAVNVAVSLPYASQKPVFCIPAMAVSSQKTQLYVNRVVDEHARAVAVKAVSQTDDSICVSGELQQGERIILAGGAFVEEGHKVAVLGEAQVGS